MAEKAENVIDEKRILKKKRSTAKGRFHRIFNQFNKGFHEKEMKDVLGQIIKDMEIAYSEVEMGHESYIEILDSDDETDKNSITQANTDMDVLYKELCEARKVMSSLKDFKTIPESKSIETKHSKDSLKIKRLDPPTFGGNIREYPSFRHDFEKLVTDSFGKDPFALKRCLTGEALMVVRGVDDNFDEMFKRLDIKYGKPEKLAEAVLFEIKRLKPVSDSDYAHFITTIDIIERCWLDLKRMHMEGEMNTATMISQIERLLPPLQKREWALRKQKPGPHLFPEFMNFLLEEKNAMEYIQSDLRETFDNRTLKTKVHTTTFEEDVSSDSLQTHLKQNQEVLKQVIDGLAQVAEAVSNGNRPKMNSDYSSKGNGRSSRKVCWYHETDKHEIGQCTAFGKLDGQTKVDLVRRNGACFSCLKTGHLSSQCLNRRACEILDENQQRCGRMHHQALHGIQVNASSFHNVVNIVNGDQTREGVLLMISRIISNGKPVNTLWDPGANISLITHEAARKLELTGRDVTLSVTKVGNTTDLINSKEYIVPLTDISGKNWQIRAYGMNAITADIAKVDIHSVVKLFKCTKERDLVRPEGKVDLLIGTDCCVLLPTKVEQIGNLQLMKNQFGYCLRGSHALLKIPLSTSHHVVRIHHAAGQQCEISNMHIVSCDSLNERLDHFFDIESLGTHCNPKCGNCKCGKCPVGNNCYTIAEERELNMIRTGLNYDEDKNQWNVTYPWKRDPRELPNNIKSAVCRLVSTEKRLQRAGMAYEKSYDDQIKDMLKRNVARKLSKREIEEYEGPVHYLPHHEVLKPESKSTPIRIVFNSSASYIRHIINDYWAKGPNVLNDLLAVLTRFRQNRIAIAGDISKMYNAIKLSEHDQHTHRFVWRDMNTNRAPDHYALMSVTFGDRPSGAIATLALRMTAEMCQNMYPSAADSIIKNSYVDDILESVNTLKDAKEFIENAEKLLERGGFTTKQWIVSGDQSNRWDQLRISNETHEKVLGMIWQPKEDVFTFRAKINFSPKRRGAHVQGDLKKSQLDSIPQNLTRRMILSQVASIYDPLGLVTPFVLSAKVLMRSLVKMEHVGDGWDDPVTENTREKWIDFFKGVFELESLRFERCIKPADAQGNPVLVVFSDGSSLAYGTCAYIRWQTGHETFESNLIMAKNRIAPRKQLSIPRLELCGAVLAARLSEKLTKEMDFHFERIIHIVDSTIVRAQIQRESYGFGTFVATRIAEIQSKSEPSDWWWVQGEYNAADLTTRVTLPSLLSTGSFWQKGPPFLCLPTDQWPIRQDIVDNNPLPDVVSITMCVDHMEKKHMVFPNMSDIDVSRFSSLDKLMRVSSMILLIATTKSFKGVANKISSAALQQTENAWLKFIQSKLPEDTLKRFQRLCPGINKDGMITVGHRMQDWMRKTWNRTEFILLPQKDQFVRLIVESFHRNDHSGVEATLAKIRSKYWIPGARRIIKDVRNRCVICKKRDKNVVGQQMGTLPIERMQPAPAFYFCAVDLFGPFTIRDTVKGRTHGKAYGVLFNCLTSRAVYVDLAEGYDTSSFLMSLRRFVALRGYPRKMISDSGTQLVAAAKELRQVVHTWDWENIKSFGVEKGMEWIETKSADSPWENGCSESLIKSVKRSLDIALGSAIMTFSELQTVFFETSNLINERPIGTKNCDPNEGSYLCPNDLILGRASIRVPTGDFQCDNDLRVRWRFVQQVVHNFWKKWTRDFFPNLIIRQKWHTKGRSMKVGDLVLVKDSNAMRGKWKLARVVEANPGRDGHVRDVTIKYKIVGPGSDYRGSTDQSVRRSVHRLVVILPVEDQYNGSTGTSC